MNELMIFNNEIFGDARDENGWLAYFNVDGNDEWEIYKEDNK